MRFAVVWRISVRFCGFRTPLTPPSERTEYQFQFYLNWDVTFILRTLLYNLVPSAFPSKNGWGGKMAFSRPTHFLREKPWGRGWLLYACVLRSFLCCIWNCIVLYNGFFSQWRKIINPKRLCFLKTFDTFWSVFFREWHLISYCKHSLIKWTEVTMKFFVFVTLTKDHDNLLR